MQYKIKPAEYNEYCKILNHYGYKIADFTLNEEDPNIKMLPDTENPKGGIVITCASTKRTRAYPAQTGNPWIKHFEEDLKRGYFNSKNTDSSLRSE